MKLSIVCLVASIALSYGRTLPTGTDISSIAILRPRLLIARAPPERTDKNRKAKSPTRKATSTRKKVNPNLDPEKVIGDLWELYPDGEVLAKNWKRGDKVVFKNWGRGSKAFALYSPTRLVSGTSACVLTSNDGESFY